MALVAPAAAAHLAEPPPLPPRRATDLQRQPPAEAQPPLKNDDDENGFHAASEERVGLFFVIRLAFSDELASGVAKKTARCSCQTSGYGLENRDFPVLTSTVRTENFLSPAVCFFCVSTVKSFSQGRGNHTWKFLFSRFSFLLRPRWNETVGGGEGTQKRKKPTTCSLFMDDGAVP